MKDELRELQRQASELSRNTAGLPWRSAFGGGGSSTDTGKKTAIVKATGNIPAATDSGDVRTPGASSAFDVKLGDDISGNQVENWSLTLISTDSYLAITEVIDAGESHYVIYNAFC